MGKGENAGFFLRVLKSRDCVVNIWIQQQVKKCQTAKFFRHKKMLDDTNLKKCSNHEITGIFSFSYDGFYRIAEKENLINYSITCTQRPLKGSNEWSLTAGGL